MSFQNFDSKAPLSPGGRVGSSFSFEGVGVEGLEAFEDLKVVPGRLEGTLPRISRDPDLLNKLS